jgi:hypothetical protein
MSNAYSGHATCNGCGYALQGLNIDGACPECARPVLASLRGDSLQCASPDYLQTLRRGITTFIAFGTASMVVIFATEVVTTVIGRLGPGTHRVGMLIGLVLSWIAMHGFIRFTAADPGLAASEQPGSARRHARFGAALMIGGEAMRLLSTLLPNAPTSWSLPTDWSGVTLPWLALSLSGLTTWAGFALFFFRGLAYAEWLFNRARDFGGVRTCRRYMILLPLIAISGTCLLGLGPLVAKMMHWLLLWKLRNRIADALTVQQYERKIAASIAAQASSPVQGRGERLAS